ncbi:MAG: hypothetical protein HC923_03650 [Myxococcales bacterium]|nr:hypothetical protein [Myxococcales bacterium]
MMESSRLEHSREVITHHNAADCIDERCTVHNRSNHSMRHFPQHYREDNGLMERICPHGIGHPDPDDWKVIEKPEWRVHGCDGCCAEPQWAFRAC